MAAAMETDDPGISAELLASMDADEKAELGTSASAGGFGGDDDMSDDDAGLLQPAVDDDMSDDEHPQADASMAVQAAAGLTVPKAAASRPKAAGVLAPKCTPARTAACKAKIVELQEKQKALVEEEDFMGAQEVKEQIKQVEDALKAMRSGAVGAKVPCPVPQQHSPQESSPVSQDGKDTSAGSAVADESVEGQPAEASPDQNRCDTSDMASEVSSNTLVEPAVPDWTESAMPDHVELTGSAAQHPFKLPRTVFDKLYEYQQKGVAWLARLWQNQQGGILADEMGLGKTVQICALLNGARKAGATHALVLLPVTLLEQWAEEARVWCPGWPVYTYYGIPSQRSAALQGVSKPKGGILLTSYSMLSSTDSLFEVKVDEVTQSPKKRMGRPPAKRPRLEEAGGDAEACEQEAELPPGNFLSRPGETKAWDVVICDEAHRMKNISTLFSRSLRKLRSKCRLLLTGTPVQNALQDMWALMDFAQPGLLGNHTTFVKNFSDPIDRGSLRNASPYQVELKNELAKQLRKRMSPYLLRRTKASSGLLQDGAEDVSTNFDADIVKEALAGVQADIKPLPNKRETIIWLLPSDEQSAVYMKVLECSEVIRQAANRSSLGIDVFQAIGLLKRLCNHPLLILPMAKKEMWTEVLGEALGSLPVTPAETADDAVKPSEAEPDALAGVSNGVQASDDARAGRPAELLVRKLPRNAESLLAQSSKLRCMALLLPALAAKGHRTLVFSQSVKMLDLVQICVLKPHGLRCLRIDGLTDITTRAEKVRKFQEQRDRFQCMLLTTGVGGVGLNLTGADRVVMVDPAWNPATDAQAVDRAYRIGQDRDVHVYRLITSGLMEDKICRLQIFKMGLEKTALEDEQQQRYFTAREIRNLFEWTEPAEGETRKLLIEKHGQGNDQAVRAAADEDGASETGWLGEWLTAGASDFSELAARPAAQQQEAAPETISAQVAVAKQLVQQAEEKTRTVSDARKDAEERYELLSQDLAEAVAAVPAAIAAKAQAEDTLKYGRTQVTAARKAEQLALQQSNKATRHCANMREQVQRAEQAQRQAEEVAGAAAKTADDSCSVVRTAEESLSQALAGVESVLKLVHEDGQALTAGGLSAPADTVRRAWKALEKVRKSFDTVAIRQAEIEDLEEQALTHSPLHGVGLGNEQADCEKSATEVDLAQRAQERRNEKEHIQEAQAVLPQQAEEARNEATNAITKLVEAGMAYADSLWRTSSNKAAQAAAKAAFRQVMPAWTASRRARDAWSKVSAQRSKSAHKLKMATNSVATAEAALANAEHEEFAAHDAEVSKAGELRNCEVALLEAEQARAKAEADEFHARQRRETLKMEVATAKGALRPARLAERGAEAERHAVLSKFSKVEKQQMKCEQAKSNAIERIDSEEYVIDQVEQAYEQKRKAREGCEEEVQQEEEEPLDAESPVADLKHKLAEFGLPVYGTKEQLWQRLSQAIELARAADAAAAAAAAAAATLAAGTANRRLTGKQAKSSSEICAPKHASAGGKRKKPLAELEGGA